MIDSVLQVSPADASEQIARQIGASEWLGPLAPSGAQPFFGIAVLSGLATYGPEFLQQRSGLITSGSPLNNHYLFWTMATLALLTSLPRFSKVSKPFALAIENVESYASVIILIAVKFLSSHQPGAAPQPELSLAGFGAVPLDTLMSIAAALNVIVINTVKLFFELMVWLIPFPIVDAALEIGQKSTCVGLMALYCYSPALATLLNLLLLTICAFVFGWVWRRTAYYRYLIIGPILEWLLPALLPSEVIDSPPSQFIRGWFALLYSIHNRAVLANGIRSPRSLAMAIVRLSLPQRTRSSRVKLAC